MVLNPLTALDNASCEKIQLGQYKRLDPPLSKGTLHEKKPFSESGAGGGGLPNSVWVVFNFFSRGLIFI